MRAKYRACVPLSVAAQATTCAAMHASLVASVLVARCLLPASLSVLSDRSRAIFRACFATRN